MEGNRVLKKSFFKKTRKGKVLRLVHENYLRTDLQFGYLNGYKAIAPLGDIHKLPSEKNYDGCLNEDKFRELVHLSPHQQLLVIDTNIALHQIDVIEYNSPATSLIVILQTVLQELRHLNLSVFKRLMSLLKDEKKSFIFLPNSLFMATLSLREKGESINDANDRAIRVACIYLQNNLNNNLAEMEKSQKKVVFLTNDQENRRRAKADGLISLSMREYIDQYLEKYPELLDLLAADDNASPNSATSSYKYPSHLALSDILTRLRGNTVLKGIIRCNKKSWTDCYVVVYTENEGRRFIAINGRENINRAVDGDLVAVELISEEESNSHSMPLCSSSAGLLDSTANVNVTSADITAEPTAEQIEGIVSNNQSSSVPTSKSSQNNFGKVVGIIRRNWRQYAGSILDTNNIEKDYRDRESKIVLGSVSDLDNFAYDRYLFLQAYKREMESKERVDRSSVDDENNYVTESSNSEDAIALFSPVNNSIPPMILRTRRLQSLLGKRLLVTYDHWPADSPLPIGHYIRIIGDEDVKSVEAQVLLHEFEVPNEAFTAEVMACLPPMGWSISEDIISQRSDLRYLPVVSIDPPGCKDIDDALHCITLPNGNLEVGVHIADVTYFVHPETPLDKEAAHRSTSTYLVERRLDMLPEMLTTRLCSLRSKEDHLAFSVLWEMDQDANIVDVKFCKSVIHSVASLTYDEAQSMLDDPTVTQSDKVGTSVKALNRLARIFRQRRIDEGALTLASPEVRFKLDQETQNPTDVCMYALKEANALVEEFMLLANITVSKKVLRHFPTLAILRRHQPPSREQFQPLIAAASIVGVNIDISSSKRLADSLDSAVKDDPYFNKLLRILSTRCMMPAQYFCSGEIEKEQWHHYGLAAPVYTHFTSPIRRYADILVHRLLSAAIGVIPLPASNSDRSGAQQLCTHMNRRHRAAQHAQRASVNIHTLLYFKSRPAAAEPAYVLSVSSTNINVLIPRFGIEGSISLQAIAERLEGIIEYDPEKYTAKIIRKAEILCELDKNRKRKLPGDEFGNNVLSIQVFQQVCVSIQVEDNGCGSKKLVVDLSHSIA